jgi:hypothetical protein
MSRILIGVDFLFMTVLDHQVIPREIPTAINRTFDSLSEDWCYQNTRFSVEQLSTICRYLDIPLRIRFGENRKESSSEYAFIVMMVKLATGMTTVKLAKEFGEFNFQRISEMFRTMITVVDSKAERFLHGPNAVDRWVPYFREFSETIERKLGEEKYSGTQIFYKKQCTQVTPKNMALKYLPYRYPTA